MIKKKKKKIGSNRKAAGSGKQNVGPQAWMHTEIIWEP